MRNCSLCLMKNTYQLFRFIKDTKNITRKLNYEIGNLKPLSLSYASYESTNTKSKKDPSPLIILPGLLGSKGHWNSFCKNYHSKDNLMRKVIAVDTRNHGDSPHNKINTYDSIAVDLKYFMDEMHIHKISLMGHSLGGRAAMVFALKYPELIERLIILDISPISTSNEFKKMPNLLKLLLNIKIPSFVSYKDARFEVRRQIFPFVKEGQLITLLLTNLVNLGNGRFGWRANLPALLNNFEYIGSFPYLHNVTFQGPVLFIGGAKSDYIQQSDFPKIKKMFPNAELKYVEGTTHLLHVQKPHEISDLISVFLKK